MNPCKTPKESTINPDTADNKAWRINKTGDKKINKNSRGSVTPVKKAVNANENNVVVLDNVKVYDVTATITITATVEGEEPIVGEYNLGTYVNEAPTAMGDKSTAKALYAYALAANTYKKACIAASQEA